MISSRWTTHLRSNFFAVLNLPAAMAVRMVSSPRSRTAQMSRMVSHSLSVREMGIASSRDLVCFDCTLTEIVSDGLETFGLG